MVARVKAEAIDGLYDNMETSEGQKDVYRIAAASIGTEQEMTLDKLEPSKVQPERC